MSENFKALAVGHIPSGLFIICAQDPESKSIDGFLGSWVQQVSFDPLLVSFCFKPGRPAYDLIKSEKIFSINIIGDHDKSYMKHFWQGYDPEQNPFSEIDHEITNEGGVVIKGAKSTIICKLKSSSQPGDHEIVVAEVLSSIINSEEAKPMVHIRKSGLDY